MNKKVLNKMLEVAKEIILKNDCVNDSGFRVGAALLTRGGKIYCGHNIENNGIQATCSERTTFSIAISEGEREFVGILVVASPDNGKTFVDAWPCGYCREFMSSFLGGDFEIYTIDENEKFVRKTLKELAPLHDFSDRKNYELDENAKIVVKSDYFEEKISNQIDDEKMAEVLVVAKEYSENTVKYPYNEVALLFGFNDENEKVYFAGCTIFDGNGTILRAPRVAMLKALANGVRKFDKIITLRFEKAIPKKLFPSYDTIQFLLQYGSPDLKIHTFDFDENKGYETVLKDEIPNYFVF